MRLTPTLAAVVLVVSSCNAQTEPEIDPSWSEEHQTCVAEGGSWGEGGLAIGPRCFPAYSDGGNSCEASSECEGFCLAKTRQCTASYQLGCLSILSGNGSQGMICFD